MKRGVNILTVFQQLQLQNASLISAFVCDKAPAIAAMPRLEITGMVLYQYLLGLYRKTLWVSIISTVSSCRLNSSGFEP